VESSGTAKEIYILDGCSAAEPAIVPGLASPPPLSHRGNATSSHHVERTSPSRSPTPIDPDQENLSLFADNDSRTASRFGLSMIFSEKPVSTFPDHALVSTR
jgi:hypothetical protein